MMSLQTIVLLFVKIMMLLLHNIYYNDITWAMMGSLPIRRRSRSIYLQIIFARSYIPLSDISFVHTVDHNYVVPKAVT